jgi:hypothetical protein
MEMVTRTVSDVREERRVVIETDDVRVLYGALFYGDEWGGRRKECVRRGSTEV